MPMVKVSWQREFPSRTALSSRVSSQKIEAVRSSEVPNLLRINPGFPEKSYLLQKLEQEKPLIGGQMPLGGPPLSREQIEIIRQWISAGAPPPSYPSLLISSLAYAENMLFHKYCIHPPSLWGCRVRLCTLIHVTPKRTASS